ncbi:MAG: small multi-drug export protein [Chloroflexi bacterium]|nr:small multi-drug export protein [Chloroflexota bacterium]
MPDELVVILTAMTPIGELRAAIPLGVITYNLSWPSVLVLAILGNLIPIPIIIFGLRTVGGRLERRDDVIGRFLRWRTARIEERWGERVRRYGFTAVMLIVAIPLPLTGAWTGSLAVYALRVPLRTGFAAIGSGIVVAGIVVTILTQAGVELFRLTG